MPREDKDLEIMKWQMKYAIADASTKVMFVMFIIQTILGIALYFSGK